MSVESVVDLLDQHSDVLESYVVVREVRLFLKTGSPHFHPEIGVKISRSNAVHGHPYHFEVSHHVHTPDQAGPYFPSRTCSESEKGALLDAISTTTGFIKSAISNGHQPDESWLIPNPDF